MNHFNYHISTDVESDNETVTPAQTIQQPIVTLEYLLNQNKMKEIALSKATHLIQLYKIELQVKQQDYLKQVEHIKQYEKQNYESLVSQLEDKIIQLQKQLKIYQHKIKQLEKRPSQHYELQKLNESACRIPKMSRNNSGRDLSNNNNKKSRYSHSKNLSGNQQNPLKRSLSSFIAQEGIRQQDLYRIQKTFLIQYILNSEEKDEKMVTLLQNHICSEPQFLLQLKGTLKSSDKFLQQFIRQLKEPSIELENKLKEYREIIKIQELIMEELNGQLSEYQDLFSIMNGSLEEIYSKQHEINGFDQMRFSIMTAANSFSKTEHSFEEFRQTVDQCQQSTMGKIKQHKSFIKQKIIGMEAENKELKRIMDDMIKLIKNNKKLQMASFGNIRSTRNTQEIDPMKEKSKSQMIYRK